MRKKIFIIFGVAVGVLLSLVLLIIALRDERVIDFVEKVVPISTQKENVPTGAVREPAQSPSSFAPVVANPDELYAKQIAGIFVERFNSYSNQNDNVHLDDVILLSTEKMAQWLRNQTIDQGQTYQGIVTNIVAVNIFEYSNEKAVVLVDAQEKHFGNNGEGQTTYRSGRVELVKLNDDWKVDGFYWE